MNRITTLWSLALLSMAAGGAVAEDSDRWPQWRGSDGQAVAEEATPPLEWSEEKNIKWKVDLPGLGISTPIVWKDRIFLTTAVDTGKPGPIQPEPAAEDGQRRRPGPSPNIYQWILMALDRSDGSVIWSRVAREEQPHEGMHPDSTQASNSPVTDGTHVFAFFGSQGIYAYDFDGQLIWEKDLGDMQTRNAFGEGASPALSGNTLIVNWDHEGDSFIVGLDKRNGEEIWRRNRPEEPTSWSTPVVVEHGDGAQVIVSATHRVTSYDVATGETIWEVPGMTLNVIPTPMVGDGVVYLTSGFRGNALMAVRLEGAKGDLTGSDNVLWTYEKDTPYVPTPVLHDGLIYMLKHNKGLLSVIDAETGELVYGIERLEHVRNVYASAMAADGKVFIVGRDGGTTVIKAGRTFEVLAENMLDDRFDASPVAVGDQLFLRGRDNLYCIEDSKP